MKMNRNFAKSEDGFLLEYAPSEFDYNGLHYNATNSEEIYNDLGYLRFIKTEMPYKEGYYFTVFYEVEDNTLVEKWQEHEEPVPDASTEEYAEAARILLGEV